MEKTTYFGFYEMVFVAVNSIAAKMFLVFSARFYDVAGSASFLISLFVMLLGFFVCFLFCRLYEKFTDYDILEITKEYLNGFIYKFFAILFIIMFLVSIAFLMRSWSESISVMIMPKSPVIYIFSFFIIGMYLAAKIGLKSIVRLHSILVPGIIVAFILLILGNVKNFDFSNIFPLFGSGKKAFYGAFLVSYISDIIALMFVFKYSDKKLSFKKTIYTGYVISSVIMVLIVLGYLITINLKEVNSFNLPVYKMARYIEYSRNTAHLESVFSIAWFLSFLLNSSLYLYLSVDIFKKAFKVKRENRVLLTFTAVILIIGLLPYNTDILIKLLDYHSLYKIAVGIIFPMIVLFIANKKCKRIKK